MPEFTAGYQARHIELNLGNVFAIGFLSLLWYGVATWTSNWAAGTTIPVISQMGVGAQVFLHAA